MTRERFHFDRFTLDPGDRRLCREGTPLELSSRYFDALALLLREPGQLVSKDRFMGEVWRGVPVTDEALTQCVRALRRALGDDATRPRFIETVPKHGYRFIAPVEIVGTDRFAIAPAPPAHRRWPRVLGLGAAGMTGGGIAGVGGGLLYGFTVNLDPAQAGMGATSVLFVLLAIGLLVGLAGGAGVGLGLGLAASERLHWSILGGGLGGLVTGAVAKLVGLDAFRLLVGQSPGDMTGAAEGALLGAAVGLAAWLARRATLARAAAWGGLCAGAAGVAIAGLGGRLLGGSLDLLLRRFPGAHFHLDTVGALLGEDGFGPLSRAVTAGIEGLLFGACMLGAIHFARQMLDTEGDRPALL